jgi:photosystem II stability/assembly factor-like uncharacterized protein
MTMKPLVVAAHSRRTVLRLILGGAGLAALPLPVAAERPIVRPALAHDGKALLAASSEGLRRLAGEGGAWEALPMPAGGVGALATHRDRPGRIFCALAAGGVARSEDGGRAWLTVGAGLPGVPVIALAVAAAKADTIYASLAGDGIWQSEDAGGTWTFVMDRPWIAGAEQDATALASVNLATGMGGIWIYAGTATGLTRVPDCFCRWQDVQPGNAMDALVAGAAPPPVSPLPAGELIHALVSAPAAPGTLYAALPSGIWTSRDAGVAWSRLIEGRASAVAAHPFDANHITAAFEDRLKQSRDGGATWSALAAA